MVEELKSILVFCPMSPDYPRLWGRTMQSIMRLKSDTIGLEFWFRGHDNPHKKKHKNILRNYNMARAVMLKLGMDALLCVESDMIVPPDTVERLAATEADIAYGLYVFRHGKRSWSAYTKLSALCGESLSEDPEAARAAWGKVTDVAGVGQGCALIRRHVLEAIPFSLWPGTPDLVSTDWMLALDAQAHGFTQKCDLGVVCGHQTYEPYPQIIWPDPEAPDLYRIEALPNPKNGRLPIKIIRKGESMTLPVSERGGQMEILRVSDEDAKELERMQNEASSVQDD